MRWWTPDCTPGSGGCDGEEPTLGGGNFVQPTGDLQVFAFRLNDDGLIQTRGILDASGAASGEVAWTMPGVVAGETDFIPPTTGNDTFSLRVTTDGTEAGIVNATAYIDKVTGDVTIRWVSGAGTPWILLDAGGQTLPGDNGFDPLLFDTLFWDPTLVTLNPADPTDGSDNIFVITKLTFSGIDYWVFSPRNGGWFEFDLFVEFGNAESGAANGYAEISMTASTFAGIPVLGYRRMGIVVPWGTSGGTPLEIKNYVHITNRKMYLSDQQATYIPSCRQNTGTDKDLGGMMWVGYYGELGGAGNLGQSDWEFANP